MQGEVVVDAYAGVGYYTFHMLVNAGAAHVHACEINPASLAGLKAGAKANNLLNRLTVHAGDNTLTLEKIARNCRPVPSRSLPSSEAVWEACMLALKPTGGVLHIHMNVEEEKIDCWTMTTVERFPEHGRPPRSVLQCQTDARRACQVVRSTGSPRGLGPRALPPLTSSGSTSSATITISASKGAAVEEASSWRALN